MRLSYVLLCANILCTATMMHAKPKRSADYKTIAAKTGYLLGASFGALMTYISYQDFALKTNVLTSAARRGSVFSSQMSFGNISIDTSTAYTAEAYITPTLYGVFTLWCLNKLMSSSSDDKKTHISVKL